MSVVWVLMVHPLSFQNCCQSFWAHQGTVKNASHNGRRHAHPGHDRAEGTAADQLSETGISVFSWLYSTQLNLLSSFGPIHWVGFCEMSEQTTMLSLLHFDTTETGSSKELELGLFQNMVFNFRVSLSPAIRGDQDKNGKSRQKLEGRDFIYIM